MEEWRKIKDYENYSVSSFGNVRNDKTERIRKTPLNSSGYKTITLSKKYTKAFLVHRLVGEHFLEPVEDLFKNEIDHIDGDILNNKVDNLRWISKIDNNRHKKKYKVNCSIYKGVAERNNRFQSYITINRKFIHLGMFDTEKEAGLAYNEYIKKNNLEYFILNEISE